MGKYRVETEDGSVYQIETEDAPAQGGARKNTESSGFLNSYWQKVNPVEQLKGAAAAISQPLTAIRAIGQEQGRVGQEAIEAFKHGDYATGARKGINWAIPLLGPELDRAADAWARGDYGTATGETLGTLTNILAPAAISKMRSNLRIPGLGTATPVETAAFDYLESQNIPVPAGTRSGNRFVKGAQKVNAYTPFGAPIAERAEQAAAQGLRTTAEKLSSQAHPAAVVPLQAGTGVRGALGTRMEGFQGEANRAYGALRQRESLPSNTQMVQTGVDELGDPIMSPVALPVDVTDLKADLRPVYDHMRQWWTPADRNASQGFQAIRSILEGPDTVPASVAEKGLGGLKTLAREGSSENAGLAKFTLTKLQKTIDDAVSSDPQALKALQQGRSQTAKFYTTKEVLDELRDEPVQAFGQLTYSKDAGLEQLKRVAKEVPGELPKIGRAWLEQVFEQPLAEGGFDRAQTALTSWRNLGPETKKLLYPNPLLRENLDKFFLGAKKLAENPNPSGSALVGFIPAQGMFMMNHPVLGTAYSIGGYGLAKLLYSPRGARLLSQGMTIPASKLASRGMLATEILKLAGEDARRLQ